MTMTDYLDQAEAFAAEAHDHTDTDRAMVCATLARAYATMALATSVEREDRAA